MSLDEAVMIKVPLDFIESEVKVAVLPEDCTESVPSKIPLWSIERVIWKVDVWL